MTNYEKTVVEITLTTRELFLIREALEQQIARDREDAFEGDCYKRITELLQLSDRVQSFLRECL